MSIDSHELRYILDYYVLRESMMFELKVLPSFHNDPFNPVLFDVNPLDVTLEQSDLIKSILEISSSDSRFAEKAYKAIQLVLAGGANVMIPEIINLIPSSALVGSGLINLLVQGNDFDSTCLIYINGNQVLTQFNSVTELETPIDLTGVILPTSYSVAVINSSSLVSNVVQFNVTDVSTQSDKVKSYIKSDSSHVKTEIPKLSERKK